MTRARVDSSPAIAGGRVYVGSSDGKLYVLDAATGAEAVGVRRWRRDHRLAGHRRRTRRHRRAGRPGLLFRVRRADSSKSQLQSELETGDPSNFRDLDIVGSDTSNRQNPSPPQTRPRSAATSSRPTRRSRCGRRRPSSATRGRRSQSPPIPACRSGLYLHIPFCRKRCQFCYFRVYTDKNAQEVERYLDVLAREWELYARAAGDRRPAAELRLLRRRHAVVPLDAAARRAWSTRLTARDAVERGRGGHLRVRAGHADRAQARRRSASMGVTRLSLGVENFDDRILEINGRAHARRRSARPTASRARSASRRSTST